MEQRRGGLIRSTTIHRRGLVPFLILPLVLSLVLAGCSMRAPDPGPVEIRIANVSGVAFDSVVVSFPDGAVTYGPIPAGGESAYRDVGRAYGYAPIQVWIRGERLAMHPIDYVGESFLEPGRYAYVIGVDDARAPESLTFELRHE